MSLPLQSRIATKNTVLNRYFFETSTIWRLFRLVQKYAKGYAQWNVIRINNSRGFRCKQQQPTMA